MSTWTGFTIDAATTVDRDDALELVQGSQSLVVSVYVTDLTGAVARGSPVDRRARAQLETRYRASGSTFMLPRRLQERRSLDPGEERDVVRVQFLISERGRVLQPPVIDLGRFRSRAKLSYGEVPAVVQDPGHPLHEPVAELEKLAKLLLAGRRFAGALAFYDLNAGWVLDEEGRATRLKNRTDTVGYVIVQELMILANSSLAEYAAENDVPVLYRNHTARGHAPKHNEIMAQLNQVYQDPTLLQTYRRRINLCMNRATYGAQLDGHFGLNLPAYVHATSPLRRYADMVTQRQIVAHLEGRALPHTAAEVDVLGWNITETLEKRRTASEEWHRARREEQAREKMDDVETMTYVEPRQFKAVVKLAVQGRPTEAFRDAYQDRLYRGVLGQSDMMRVLFETNPAWWRELRQETVDWLWARPWMGFGVADAARQVKLFRFSVTSRRAGPDHRATYRADGWARREGGDRVRTQDIQAENRKLAEQRAVVRLMAKALGLQPPRGRVRTSAKRERRPANPVHALTVHAQQTGKARVVWEYSSEGPADSLQWTCKATLRGQSASAVDLSKKRAQQAAAEKLLSRMEVSW